MVFRLEPASAGELTGIDFVEMKFHIITIFPETFASFLAEPMVKRALTKGFFSVKFYNPRDFVKNPHRKVDDRPFGGGPGMVMQAGPILAAVSKARRGKKPKKIILLSPRGKLFTNNKARQLSYEKDIIIICGRYEGIDARVKKILKPDEYSIGPYVLRGGELPAMVFMDAITRHIPGVLGKAASLEEMRPILPHEVYTRPRVITHKGKQYSIPKVLFSGHHGKISRFHEKKGRPKFLG